MNIYRLTLIFAGLMLPMHAIALSPEALEGKDLYPACEVCHNQAQDPPLGPPMWGVKRRYLRGTIDEEDFVETMVAFVKAPSLEIAIHDEALEQLGLMPPMPLPDALLQKISTYILEEQFPAPCDHWRIAVRRATEKGDPEHAKKDQFQLDRFCQ